MLKSSSLCLYSSNLGTFWLKIEQFWPFEEISIFSNGGHLWYRTALTDTILEENHPMTFIKILFLMSKWFQRRRFKCEKLMDGRTLTHDKISHGLWPGELKKWFFLLKQDLNLEFFTQANIMRGKFVISNTTDNLLKRNRYKE